MIRSLFLTLALAAFIGCPPPSLLPDGCGKDTDCKGARVCVRQACVDPPPRAASNKPVSPREGIAEGGDGGMPTSPLPFPAPLVFSPSAQFHGDAHHSGLSAFHAPTSAPHEIAKVSVGGVIYSSPAITADGTAIFGSHDKSIYAAREDQIQWKRATGDLVWSSPALGANGVVYVGSDDDQLYAIDLKSGDVNWKFRAGPCRTSVGVGPEASRCDVDGVTVAPDGTIYAAADGLYAIGTSGAQKWKFWPGNTHCATHPAVAADGTVYVGCHDDALYAVDSSGNKKWEFRTADDVDSSPALATDGTIYFGSDDRKLYAIGENGALKFAVTTGGAVRSSPAVGPTGTVVVGSFDGVVYAVHPDGVVAWTFHAADRILSSPLIDADGVVLIGSEDDRLYAISPDGRLLWSVLLGGDVDSSPVLAADGLILVGADDRALHVLKGK